MKTVLFVVLCSPVAAFASYSCHTYDATHNGMGIDESDPKHVVVTVNHQFFNAIVLKDESGAYGSKTYQLLKAGDGAVAGVIELHYMPQESFCGRRYCPPTQDTCEMNISASLTLESQAAVEFSCDETKP